jgi:hypothetical protein
VHLVLGGRGLLKVKLDGKALPSVRITADRLYTLASLPQTRNGLLELRFSPGLFAYAFTFG